MKKIFLILGLVLAFASCKNNKKSALSPQQEVYCVWINNSNGTKTFYRCVETEEEMQQVNIELRNANKFHTDYKKATCSDCK